MHILTGTIRYLYFTAPICFIFYKLDVTDCSVSKCIIILNKTKSCLLANDALMTIMED